MLKILSSLLFLLMVFGLPQILAPLALATNGQNDPRDGKEPEEKFVGTCALILKFRDWNERAMISIERAEDGFDFELGNPKTFTYMQTQPDGTEKEHQGIVPVPLRKSRIHVELSRDEKIGWPRHEEVTVELSVLAPKGKHVVEGPFKSAVIRKFGETREATEDLPFVSGTARIEQEQLEFRFGCSKTLGT